MTANNFRNRFLTPFPGKARIVAGIVGVSIGMLYLSSAFGEEVQTTFTVDGGLNDHQIYVLGYHKAFEAGSGRAFSGKVDARTDRVRNLILSQATGYPNDVSVSQLDSNKYEVTATFVNKQDIRDNPQATKQLVRLLGNPRIVVNVGEINHSQSVMRSKVEATLENSLLRNGYRTLNFPGDYLARLEERKKSIEIRRTNEASITTSGLTRSIQIESMGTEYILDWSVHILGSGNEVEAVEKAKEVGGQVILVGGAYAIPIPLPEAAKAWRDQGYHKARAYVNLQAMVVATKELIYSNSMEMESMDFSASGAGNKALVLCAQSMGKELVYEMLENLRSRDIRF